MKPNASIATLVLFALGFAGLSGGAAAAPDEQARKIEELTGGRTKIVWDQGFTHLPENPQGGLCAYDTADGRSRVLNPGMFWMMPFITPDGRAVIFNLGSGDGGNQGCKIIDWDGSNERWLVRGEYGWAHCAWVDPETKHTWIYVSDANRNGWNVDKCAFTKVFRVRLDKPDVKELVYETKRGGVWLSITPDGKRLWGGLRDSQEQSMLDIAAATVTPVVSGCASSHSPTTDHFFAFTGTHRHFIMHEWKNGQATDRRQIQVNTMPGVDGRESVQNPRWSTDPRIFSIMGPEQGPPAQIYLGRFNKEITAVEAWVRVTNNGKGNGWSHAWVQTGQETLVPQVKPAPSLADSTNPPRTEPLVWPTDPRDLVFALRNGNLIGNPPVAFSASGKPLAGIAIKHTLWRHYGPNYELILSGSPVAVSDAAAYAVASIAQNRSLTLLAGVTAGAFEDSRPRRLVAIMDGDAPVLSLVQTGNQFSLAIVAPWTVGEPVVWPLPVLRERRAFAFAATIGGGAVTLYVDGKPLRSPDLSWTPARLATPQLVLGDALRQTRASSPALDSVAIVARVLTDREIAEESRRWGAERSARKAIPRIRLKGRLRQMAPVPDATKIAPYTQALVVGEYEVTGVLQGEYRDKTVSVAHWGMLNRQRQPVADRKAGEVCELQIETFELQPQLEPEYLADTDRDPGGALYYDMEN